MDDNSVTVSSLQKRQEYKNIIITACNNGLFNLNTIDISDDALKVIKQFKADLTRQEKENQKVVALNNNKIVDNSSITLGQRVYSLLYGYGIIKKANNRTVILELDSGSNIKVSKHGLQHKSHHDTLKEAGM